MKKKPLTHAQRGALGAAARNAKLSKKRRKEIASTAARAMWSKKKAL